MRLVGVPGEVVVQLGSAIDEVAATGFAPATSGVSLEGVEIGVTFKRDPGQAVGGGGEQQRSERGVNDRGGHAGRGERVGSGPGVRWRGPRL